MRKLKEQFPNILSIIYLYLIGLALFFIFRLTLFLVEIDRIGEIPDSEKWANILGAFWMGIRFDTVISGYILLLPFILLTVALFFRKAPFIVYRIIFLIVFIVYTIAFLLCAIDIPFFGQFFSRLTVVALEWMSTPAFVFKMIIQEPMYWLYIVPLTAICLLFWFCSKRIIHHLRDKHISYNSWTSLTTKIIVSVLFAGLIFVGIRGRITKKSPIRVGTAYFSNYAFINKLGLNPVFTFLRSALDEADDKNKKISLMNPSKALELVRKDFNIVTDTSVSPIARLRGNPNDCVLKKNIVVVLMESMTIRKMSLMGYSDYNTPCLDSLANNGYFFTNIYSSGIHTFNGIYSTLFGYPSLLRQHPMQAVEIKKYKGITSVLRQQGYYNIYITTYDGQFDNAEGFMMANDFDRVVSQKDYPSDMVKSTLGVPDDYMFEFAVPIMTETYKKQGHFFSILTTTSDHGPYVIPEYFKPKPGDIKNQIVEYADWSIGKFISLSSKEEWFNNTIFVFIADHGAPLEAVYDIPINYHHVPLVIYAPKLLKPKKFEQVGG